MFSVDLQSVPAVVAAAAGEGAGNDGASSVPTNLAAVAGQLTHSSEDYSDFATWAYGQFMGRAPDAPGLSYWVGQLQNGLTDEQLESRFLSAPEYIADHGGSDVNWVIGMYHDLLGRAPDSGGLQYWTNRIEAGEPEYNIALGFAASSEREAMVVQNDYSKYLGRSASADEVNYWVNQFLDGARNEDVIAGFIGSPEYYNDPRQGAGNPTTWLDSVFEELYGRLPTGAELNSWLSQLGQGGTAPTAPSVTAAAASATQVNLSWNSVSGATGYLVDEYINGAWQQIGQVDSGTTSVTVNELSPDTTYQFDVGAYNSAGTAWSTSVAVTTTSPPTAPSVTAAAESATQVNLSWNSVSGATGYLVDEYINGAWQQIGQVDSGTTSVTVNELSPDTTYQFDVGAYNSAGTAWSTSVAVTTSSPPVTVVEPAAGAAYTPVSGTLFGAVGPVFTDVHQGAEGDCWLMAGFAEVAARYPQDIRNMFTYQGTGEENGATVGLYSVRFFNRNGVAEYVTVDTELPAGGQYYDRVQNGVLWVALAEKAYAEANGAGYVTSQTVGSDSYDALNGGFPSWALQAITGRSASDFTINPTDVAAAWNAGQLIVLGSSPYADDSYGIVGDSSGTHAYAVVDYDPSRLVLLGNTWVAMPFELYNPWGEAGMVSFHGHQVFGGAFYANGALLAQDFASESIGAGAQPAKAAEQAAAIGTTPFAVHDDIGILARDVAAAATPANSAHDSLFAETSWLDAMY